MQKQAWLRYCLARAVGQVSVTTVAQSQDYGVR
jgi:hypothetical protein